MTAVSTTPTIVDAQGQLIERGSIVDTAEGRSSWYPYQGLVIEPDSRLEGDEHTVAVYFDKEVHSSRFMFRRNESAPTEKWARENALLMPRIVFFKPSELIVQPEWKLETLVKRLFGPDNCVCLHTPEFPLVPGERPCIIKDCPEKATCKSLVNLHGTISVFYVCKACFKKTNGLMTDSWPETKESP